MPTTSAHRTVRTIDMDGALAALRAVVKEKGADYVYQGPDDPEIKSCVNAWVVDGVIKPLCIVGCALHYLGVPVELLYQRPSHGIHFLASFLEDHGFHITPAACAVLAEAQHVQDAVNEERSEHHNDPSWGHALAVTESVAAQLRVGDRGDDR